MGACARRVLILLLLLSNSLRTWANATESALVGSPLVTRHASDLDVFPQNFAVAQDSQGLVFVGGANGVQEFDGEGWRLIVLPNRDIVRSLAVTADDLVMVGGYNCFGYLRRDPAGLAQFHDLSPRFRTALKGREFADIWQILTTPEGVYFRALRDVFFWDSRSDRIRHWTHEGRFGALAHQAGHTVLQFRGVGFKRRIGDDWQLLPGSAPLRELVYSMAALPEGGWLTLGVAPAWHRLSMEGQVEVLRLPVAMPPPTHFSAALSLADGGIAFSGRDGLIHILDGKRQRIRKFKLDPGFLSGLHVSVDGGFLVSADQAIYRVAWPTDWSVLGEEHGVDGSLARLRHWNGADYLMGSAGVLRLRPQPDSTPLIEPLDWVQTSAADLLGLDASRALLATPHKLMLVDGSGARELSPELVYPRLFQRSRFHPGRVYIGTENGLRYLDVKGADFDLSPPPGLDVDALVVSLVEVSADELWFGSERHGVWRVRLDGDLNIVEQSRAETRFGLEFGVVPAAQVSQLVDGTLLVSTQRGFFRLEGERFVRSDLYGLNRMRAPEEFLRIATGADGTLWAYGIGRLLQRPPAGRWNEVPVRQLRRGAYLSHRLEADGSAVFVASQSLLIRDAGAGSAGESSHDRPGVQLRAVTRILANGDRQHLPLRTGQPVVLDYGDFGINFQFALPNLAHPRRSYRGRLLGYETEFSEWSQTHAYTYSRLSPGVYTLEVQARDGDDQVSSISAYTLQISPPWYLRWWALGLWLLLAAALLRSVVRHSIRRRVARLELQRRQLEATVNARTLDLANANQQLQEMANLDGLTGIANRRRLDQYLGTVWAQARERGRPVAVLAIDVDHFKRFNDSHGHLAGDQFLKDLVPRLSQCLRRSEDLLARYGGEEFLAVLPGADLPTATAIAASMREAIETAALGTTISIGVASHTATRPDPHDLIQAADLALYAAKHAGRNRVELAPAPASH